MDTIRFIDSRYKELFKIPDGGHSKITIQSLLHSKKGQKLLKEYGCFEAMEKILDTMKAYLD